MKTLIVAVNSKYIHTSLAVRLLYLASYREHDTYFREYTIKMDFDAIGSDILSEKPDVVAFSCYIWNISCIRKACAYIKERAPEIVIALGGPEVTYDPEYYLRTVGCDYILQGEGEELFPAFLRCLEMGDEIRIPGISSSGFISHEVVVCDLSHYELAGSPYGAMNYEVGHEGQSLGRDLNKVSRRKGHNDVFVDASAGTSAFSDERNRILYFESGRGCPFRCQYCLSSLEKGLRFFPEEWLLKQLEVVCNSDAKIIKFLDRSFCANGKHAIWVLDYIFRNHRPGQQYQIEVNADSISEEVISFIEENAPEGLLRLEVGIQSTCEESNRAVGRMQNYARLEKTVKRLQDSGKCDLHLDLIAGLPYENLERFGESFDCVFSLGARELQLGFLKLLRGTALRDRAVEYGYVYQEDPPYEIRRSAWLSEEDIRQMHLAEDMLEKYSNSHRFAGSLQGIMSEWESAFGFFRALGNFYEENGFPKIGYHPHDLFLCLDRFTEGKYRDDLIQDYFRLFKRRPKRWWEPRLAGDEKKRAIHMLAKRYGLPEDVLFRYGQVERLEKGYLVVIYRDGKCEMKVFAE